MKVIWDYLTEADKKYMLAQITLEDIFKELRKRAQLEDDEDLEEEEEEEEIVWGEPKRIDKVFDRLGNFPHEAEKLDRLGVFTNFFRTANREVK